MKNTKEKFAELGYLYIPNVLTQQEADHFADLMLGMKKNNQLKYEGAVENPYYKESFGGNHPEFESKLRELTPQFIEQLGVHMTPANSFSRIYYNGGTLPPHKDRVGLDYTLSITLRENLKKDWPLWCEDKLGNHVPISIKKGDGGMMMGNSMTHWRENLVCGPDEYVIQLFMHWSFA